MFKEWGLKCVQIKRLTPFGGQKEAIIAGNFGYLNIIDHLYEM